MAAKSAERDKLEHLARYVSRPPIATERLALTDSAQVRDTLKTPYRDGTTHGIFEPMDFIARLGEADRQGVAQVPLPPRGHGQGVAAVPGVSLPHAQVVESHAPGRGQGGASGQGGQPSPHRNAGFGRFDRFSPTTWRLGEPPPGSHPLATAQNAPSTGLNRRLHTLVIYAG